ncbi:N-formylglutamate amidohydrolase [Methylobrevis albus]|uniref:N-formylglutamate amidohydrolase n=1 Tax=Methylobrevis albus TaxID=2793297 RepID=A0A931I564_9HYPH|nr:N-formylglutamate amidohydrolase [Methylobrevis albus]MBH0239420.1 N-formylglutamate amidohydrolase [Methylobrevis albus]
MPDLSPPLSPAAAPPFAPPFAPIERIDGSGPLLVLCDHASNRLPPGYGSLGLPQAELERHIGYDIGAEAVTRGLCARLGARGLMTRFSRLLIDPNRGEDDPTLIMRLSDGAVVPGNRDVDAAEREHRIETFHRPYHTAIAAEIDAMQAAGLVPVIFSVHSFTPVWRGWPRPWHVALLWDEDPRLAKPLIAALEAEGDLVVGDNEPYDGALLNDTMFLHGTARGLPHVLIEVRQDLIGDAAGADAWAARLARLLPPLLALPALGDVAMYGSRAGPVPPLRGAG